jgi:hypothetical protein
LAKTLSAILDGVEDAIRDAPEGRMGKIAPVTAGEEDWSKAPLPVEFDVAVTEADKVSRINFSVPIIYGAQRIGRT